ncbi:MAG: T9SS type A sorting domain-containing protein [Bacteroidetes bacterium]|nr:T9SS type A sorting domain-containing protein [Bacteroidota bacterium]
MRFLRNFFSIVTFLSLQFTFAQTLSLPPRQNTMLTGSQFSAAIAPLSLTARENYIYNEVISGNIPNFYRTLTPVTSTAIIAAQTKSVTYYVIPDYLAVGPDTNYFLCPMSPMLATKIADTLGCTLPTRKMVNDIYAQATLTMVPLTIPASGTMTTVQAFAQHNIMVKNQRATFVSTYSLGTLTGGDKKDIIISNLIYSTANRVIIYGWHTSVGNPIQPMTNVHADTYMDYSHGIRLVQNDVMYYSTPTTVKAILQSTLNALLSDEGVINPPEYPYGNPITSLAVPKSFAVLNKGNNTIDIKVKNDGQVTHYKVYTSNNGVSFSPPLTIIKTALNLSAVTANQPCYIKIAAYNSTYSVTSATSEVLAAVPCNIQDSLLVVNGFDRVVAGNTFDFIKQHGGSAFSNSIYFSSATNEAIQDGLFNVNTYKALDWLLGKESTINETFNTTEQTAVSNYLKQGGNLLVSGSEIGWDLDQNGSVADQNFYNNYLKANYVSDAPNSQPSTWYAAPKEISQVFTANDTLNFDNGSNGTYNVDYPDVITTSNGSSTCLRYTSALTDHAAVCYSGLFPSGTVPGKLIHMAFPFETVYPATKRNDLMKDIWHYFFASAIVTAVKNNLNEKDILIYPNPANKNLFLQQNEEIKQIRIIDLQGREIMNNYTDAKQINIEGLLKGIYFVEVTTLTNKITKKFVKD